MGMSASQARLLSITARLNHVELETQYLSNAKIRLSDSTQKASDKYVAASDKYVAALNKTEYQYNYYNAAGEKITMDLTGAALTEYGELKNQYGLINSAGQILVSETDAANFENSNTLEEFLEKYGVLGELGTGDTILVNNPEYETAMDQYEEDMANYNEEYIKYEQEIADWQSREPSLDDPKYQIPDPDWVPPVTGDDDDDVETWSLYEAFTEGTAGGCFTCSSNPDSTEYNTIRHYNHTLAHMLVDGGDEYWSGGLWWTNPSGGKNGTSGDGEIMAQIAKAIEGKYCCGGGSDCNGEHEHTYYGTEVNLDCGSISCDSNQLITDKIRELMQDIEDYYYDHGSKTKADDSDPEWIAIKERYYHLIEHDLKGVIGEIEIPKEPVEVPEAPMIPDEEAYNADHDAWVLEGEAIKPPTLPPEVTVPQYLEEEVRKIEDLDKAQWYVNLWHRMNGTSDFKAGFGNSEDYIAGNGWASKSETDQNWAVLKDGDMNSPEYLKYAIENGLITIEQVQFTDPSESGTGIENAVWTSIVFSSAQDITEQKDQVAITLAETEYNQTLREIEAKDKEYDTQIKKLDTEHNALQTEYDSIKSVIEKNVERSFKIFS